VTGKRGSLACAAAALMATLAVVAAGALAQDAPPSPPVSAAELDRAGAARDLISPTTAPAGAARIRQWFEELTDTNPPVRDRARVALMGIKPEELGALREIVDAARPLAPAQAAVLRDVVVHVYVGATGSGIGTGRPFAVRRSGFLGVLLEPVQSGFGIGLPPPPQPGPAPGEENPPPDFVPFQSVGGVLIRETWPGFAGFRYLRVGDVVLGTGGAGVEPTRAPTVPELRAAVQATAPGRTLDLQVLRWGRVMDVAVTVSARPSWAEDEFTTRQMQSRRLKRAEIYWQFAFAPLLYKDDGML
jgi:hypothetical protein